MRQRQWAHRMAEEAAGKLSEGIGWDWRHDDLSLSKNDFQMGCLPMAWLPFDGAGCLMIVGHHVEGHDDGRDLEWRAYWGERAQDTRLVKRPHPKEWIPSGRSCRDPVACAERAMEKLPGLLAAKRREFDAAIKTLEAGLRARPTEEVVGAVDDVIDKLKEHTGWHWIRHYLWRDDELTEHGLAAIYRRDVVTFGVYPVYEEPHKWEVLARVVGNDPMQFRDSDPVAAFDHARKEVARQLTSLSEAVRNDRFTVEP